MKLQHLVIVLGFVAFEAHADSSTLDAAIGGGIGGAAGAALGNEIGGRDGAIIGGALGGAVGAAYNTKEEPHYYRSSEKPEYNNVHYYERDDYERDDYERHDYDRPSRSGFCPPGQAKKGRC